MAKQHDLDVGKKKSLVADSRPSDPGLSSEEALRLLHELQLHQMELELQNEALRAVQVEIENARARYADLYDLAPVGYCTLSSQGQMQEVNLTAAKLLGVERLGMIGEQFTRFVLEADQDQYYLHSNRLFETGEPQECELRLIRADASPFWAHLRGTSVQGKDEATLCRVAISDISRRKEVEAERSALHTQLMQAQKMESIGRLAGGVAHDFNNMLSIILGYAELALEKVEIQGPLYNDLEAIRNAAQRSASLTRQLLVFARKQAIAPQVLDLNTTVEGMLKMLERLIGEEITLDWKPDPDLWQVVMDPVQIDQILANLCVNAKDAISGNGTISVATHNAVLGEHFCVRHTGAVPGEYVVLVVGDNGCGMDAETLLLIFDPFFSTKGLDKGTGLGLASVYGILKQNNGFVSVRSVPGQGTTFEMYLPRMKDPDLPSDQPEGCPDKAKGSATVLLVECDAAVLNMMRVMLARQGYKVLDARTLNEAIRVAEEKGEDIDLLLTNWAMPNLNGRDLAAKLMPLCPHLKSLFMSGYASSVLLRKYVSDKNEFFIRKPFTQEELRVKLNQALKG